MLNPRAPRFSEVLRISLTTGRVVGRWKLPLIDRALLATNADGLWLAPSNESGFSQHASAAEKLAQGSLYHVAAGMRKPARVFDIGIWGARWLVANGKNVWLAAGRASRPPALWRFHGPNATPKIRAAATVGGVRRCGDLGEGPVTVVGGQSGIYCVSDPGPNAQRVEWLGSTGGRSKVIASVRTRFNYEFLDNAVLYHGAYYFVDPPASQTAGDKRPVLYRAASH